jgi:hypothetical protein
MPTLPVSWLIVALTVVIVHSLAPLLVSRLVPVGAGPRYPGRRRQR